MSAPRTTRSLLQRSMTSAIGAVVGCALFLPIGDLNCADSTPFLAGLIGAICGFVLTLLATLRIVRIHTVVGAIFAVLGVLIATGVDIYSGMVGIPFFFIGWACSHFVARIYQSGLESALAAPWDQ